MRPRYLTKSRFKLALECPTKIYYTDKPKYANQKLEDPFLLALADGGFQVGELAKYYYPGGHEVETRDYDEALNQTNELLSRDRVTIYEAAFRFGNLFIRADILTKNGNHLDLIEVKSKSFDISSDSFYNRNGDIYAKWQPYLYDVAFQRYVIANAFPQYSLCAHLMMADKNAPCPTDGLNQKFRIVKDDTGRKGVFLTKDLTPEDLSTPILVCVNVEQCCGQIYSDGFDDYSFSEYIDYLADCYAKDEKIVTTPSSACSRCEFQADEQEQAAGLKSGFQECWKKSLNWTDGDFLEGTVLDIWNFRKKDQLISENRIKLSQIDAEDIDPKSDGKPGIASSQRQWLQVLKVQNNDTAHWIDAEGLVQEMERWVYPLHFIDFETAMVPIPFNKGRYPYEGIAFQFSHHVVHSDGRIEHRGQYLNATPGVFPNYDFVRKLKQELEQDGGSIFRYAPHENTYLNMIYRQLCKEQAEIPDRDEICEFIRSITKSVNYSPEKWEGPRNMIDMFELVKRYYYDPSTKGSNSIKYILPAILNQSNYLKEKYAEPIYGALGGIPSLNYKDWTWVKMEDGQVIDPYQLLPRLFNDISEKDADLFLDNDQLRDGGAASTAYARMQFEEMSEYERNEIQTALLKYCELDTFAMVMIYEGWKDLLGGI